MSMGPVRSSLAIGAGLLAASGACGAPQLPADFIVETVASGFTKPVGIAFTGDGRIFVTEQQGIVWVIEDGSVLPEPFIDLQDEVNGAWDRGLLGLALDPDFLTNRQVYLLYVVDPIYGEPDEAPQGPAFGRITRYTGTPASNGNIADAGSRLVLLGAGPGDGMPICEPSHSVGSLRFGSDGSLFASAGDGAHFDGMDPGGLDPDCFADGWFGPDQDVGAFRAQYLDSLAGKILRIDPATGEGLDTNPFWTGDANAKASRIWALGVRNPFRFAVKPGSPPPGTLYVGDVGWYLFEEVNVARGGENFGWPCEEGTGAAPSYPNAHPAHSGCDGLLAPANPGVLTDPIITWSHFDPSQSLPIGYTGATSVGGTFYAGACYPAEYAGALFLADYSANWIRALHVDADDTFVGLSIFATAADRPVDIAADPVSGDLHYVAIDAGEIRRIHYDVATAGDTNGDCKVNVTDLLAVLAAWGACPGCPADLDGDGLVTVVDLLILLGAWS